MNMTGGNIVLNLYSFILEASASGICSPYSLSALDRAVFCDFSASRHRSVAKLARGGSLELRRPCPCVVCDPYGRGAAVARSQSRVYEVYARSSNDRRMIS